jgi:hypothetical protein
MNMTEVKIWLVLRADSVGNMFLVQDELDQASASALVETLTARGHKQTYTAHAYFSRAERNGIIARLKVSV